MVVNLHKLIATMNTIEIPELILKDTIGYAPKR